MKKVILILAALSLLAFTPKTTPTVGAAWTTVCDEPTAGPNGNMQFKVHNTGANPFTDCQVETWVGPALTDWKVISSSWTECETLAAGAKSVWEVAGSSHERIRVQVKSAAGTSAYCRPYGN